MTRRSVVLAGLLLLAALVLAWISWTLFQRSTPEQARPQFYGDVVLFVSEPASRGTISADDDPSRPDLVAVDTDESVLDLEIHVRPVGRVETVWFAVVLTNNARLATDGLEPSGAVPDEYERPASVFSYGGAADRVFYLTQVNWPPVDQGSGSTVVFGRFFSGGPWIGKSRYVWLTVPMAGGMVVDHGETWALSTPKLGHSVVRGAPDFTLVQQHGSVDSNVVDEVASHAWQQPATLKAEFLSYANGRLIDGSSFQQAGTRPVEPFGNEWRRRGSLKVDTVFTRPGVQTRQEREQFLAGVLVSLAAGFFAWALELLVGPERVPVLRLLRRSQD